MNQHLQNILNNIQQDKKLSEEEKNTIIKSLKDADKEFEITNFKLEHKEKAVEAQNRELEIESSLERVRTVAMGMRKPDDMLDVCKSISQQLELLNVKELRNVQTAIFNEVKHIYMNYEYYGLHSKTFITEVDYTLHPVQLEFANQMLKGEGSFFTTTLAGTELNKFIEHQKASPEFVDPFLFQANSLTWYWYSLGPIAFGISAYSPITEADQDIVKRFRNIFDLSYRRYLDIELAISQAKEALIETSLERVRAQAMAMRTPDDLTGICEVLFTELNTLGFSGIRNAMINIHNDEKETFVNYDYSDEIGKSINHLVYNIHPVIEKQIKQMRSAGDAFSETYFKGKDLEDWKAFRKRIGEKDDPRIEKADALFYYFYSIGTGSIGISTFSVIAEEKLNVLKRFRNVFNLSYQRYTDIALAEAQAKEARIETALERVRAVAMAMKKSDELVSVCEVMYNELTSLEFTNIRNAQIAIENDERQSYFFYVHSDFEKISGGEVGYDSSPLVKKIYQSLGRSKDAFYEREYSKSEMEEWRNWRRSVSPLNDPREETADYMCWYMYAIGKGHIGISTFNAITAEQIEIVKRFKTVFELSYKRFDDLQKAEAQTRESQIQLALERVRARTMAMQKSSELLETSLELFQQLKELGEPAEQLTIGVIKEEGNVVEVFATIKGVKLLQTYRHDINERFVMHKMVNAWKAKEKTLVIEQDWQELIEYNEYRNKLVQSDMFPVDLKPGDRRFLYVAFYSKGTLALSSNEPRPKETLELLLRFAKVFDQTYTRFLDLKNAEAQTKESQIQLALERVRARTMAMQKSDELPEAANLLFQQVQSLGMPAWSAGYCTWNEDRSTVTAWMSSEGVLQPPFTAPTTEDELFIQMRKGIEEGKDLHVVEMGGEELVKHYKYMRTLPVMDEILDSIITAGYPLPTFQIMHQAYYSKGFLLFITYEPVPDAHDIFKRFANVFDQTYTRFLDLKKAEAQAREALIEAALERTRTQSMIMQHSKELDDTLRVFHEQVLLLNIPSAFSFLWLPDEEKDKHIFWAAWKENNLFKSKAINYPLDRNEPATAQCLVDWKGTEPIVSYHVPPAGVENYFAAWSELIAGVEQLKPEYFSSGLYYVEAFMKYGCFGVMVENDLTEDEKKLLGRFAIEFERTYRRFLDLQKAEAQARESKIEASLERVRSKAMSMQKSEDLAAAITIVFEELGKLDLGMLRCGIGILNKEKRTANVWTTTIADNDTVVQVSGDESMDIHPLLSGAFDAWLNHEDHNYTLKGEDLNNYYKAVAGENFKLPASQSLVAGTEEMTQYYYNAVWSSGGLFAFRETPFPEEAQIILRRFADVFTLTYTRYSDLKQAEAQAKEAKIEVALERVRSRTLAMQRSDELAETAAVLFRQLILLGIQPNRLYIAIVKNETGTTEFWITDEDGSQVSSAFETNLNDNPTFQKMFDGWKQEKKSLVIDMQGAELQEYFKYLTSINVPFKGGLTQTRRVQDIAYFNNGFIGMASPEEQSPETLQLLERFAYVFNLTFTRFNDLKLAEAHAIQAEQDLIAIKDAKQKAEEALTELQSAQKQLIQSEKMASLGELTAGIAHEIQNPLNFVNNFSEVSVELIKEMVDEVEKGNNEEAKAIADDLIQNLEKINHHGKRADGIVKGMLQHSRTTGSTKEPTDINKLADEYLRLAYHGLRAKDKSFNATLKTDFDETVGKINIIPQDIGRVMLNLITNAFYATGEKKKQANNIYEPIVSVTTKSTSPSLGGRGVCIIVSDNGNGIPKNIVDKIFQPFFTTKPTGQGTGLGLSLAYDIVKAHGGELKVETKENEGSTFIMQLPFNV